MILIAFRFGRGLSVCWKTSSNTARTNANMDFSSTFSIEVSKLTPSGRSSSSWVSRNFSKTFFPQHFQRLFSWYGNLFVIELAMTNTLTASRRDPNPYPKKIPLCEPFLCGLSSKYRDNHDAKGNESSLKCECRRPFPFQVALYSFFWGETYRFWNQEHFLFF